MKDEVVVLFEFVFVWMGEERMTQEEDVGERLLILDLPCRSRNVSSTEGCLYKVHR